MPWQILAAINEVETDYGRDLSVSRAGAEGWMQFEPSTWLQYGVDALDAGYADPYNPVDAIFAAARYLHAAGAAKNLHTAILAYNHSEAYVELGAAARETDLQLPEVGDRDADRPRRRSPAGDRQAGGMGRAAPRCPVTVEGDRQRQGRPGRRTRPPRPQRARRRIDAGLGARACARGRRGGRAKGAGKAAAAAPQFVELMSAPNAAVVAVQDGRIMKLGSSRKLGKYVILRDIYGDVFTYAGLGSIAPSYRLPKVSSAALVAAAKSRPPRQPRRARPARARPQSSASAAGAGTPAHAAGEALARPEPPSQDSVPAGTAESVPAAMGKVRLFAHPGNPDALAAAARVTTSAPAKGSGRAAAAAARIARRRGHGARPRARAERGAKTATCASRSSRPATPGRSTRPVLANWKELDAALHPQGAKGEDDLLGATASDVFLLSKSQLELAVLSDPGIDVGPRSPRNRVGGDRQARAGGARLPLAQRSEADGAARCARGRGRPPPGLSRADAIGDAVDISAVNGVPIAGHQGSGSITDTTIRTLLTLQGEFVPARSSA